jgi:phosphomannomutase / phosphoglucomutase
MRWEITKKLPYNSFDYFEKTLITDNGFREYDVRWILGKEINPNGFILLGKAYGTFVREVLKEERVVVGHDFRSYSQDLCTSLTVGLMSTGVHVIDIGLAVTPLTYFAQHYFGVEGAAMVTASHNENGWTGLKLADGLSSTLGPDGIQKFREIVMGGKYASGKGSYESTGEVFDAYRKEVLSAGMLSRPVKVVLAAGNGTAGRFTPTVLRDLGCDVHELDCTADWTFPRHNPNPEEMSFLEDISRVTRESGAELGIGIDGDGDRVGVVDDQGRPVFADKLGLLVARWISASHPKRAFVIDVKSTGLFANDDVLKAAGAEVVMWKTGHSYIKAKVNEVHAIAGFEKSGHWFFNKPYGRGYDDATLAAAQVLRLIDAAGKPLSKLIDDLPTTYQSPTLGVECADEKKYAVVDQLTKLYEKDHAAGVAIGGEKIQDLITVNGVRFVFGDGSWGLIRASSNKPSLVIVAESTSSQKQMVAIVDAITVRLREVGVTGEYDQAVPRA